MKSSGSRSIGTGENHRSSPASRAASPAITSRSGSLPDTRTAGACRSFAITRSSSRTVPASNRVRVLRPSYRRPVS